MWYVPPSTKTTWLAHLPPPFSSPPCSSNEPPVTWTMHSGMSWVPCLPSRIRPPYAGISTSRVSVFSVVPILSESTVEVMTS